ncbi:MULTISPECIES: serine hydrolase domain-containing protein [unclassified Microbulbifer]|uniref:serine hydrolase domain-containing protein n=1 Tax=unclassified Microbulbifer TaxID=2619833 RepID=UPI0027E5485C|nr:MULTISPECIES: serine hydrolase domain-containing protein [unclassified Microbulbifer]
MIRRNRILLVTVSLAIFLGWLLWPAYQFFAYNKGSLPLPPFGWLELPRDNPSVQELYDPAYAAAGTLSLDVIEKHREKIASPAISAAVSGCGKLLWAGAVGWSDIESKTPVTTRTRFRIGSTSKALTGTGLARLVETGRIDLDTPISNYLNPLPNPQWADITPRQLASHMAGLPDYKENRDWMGLYHTLALRDHYDSMVEALDVFDGSPLLYQPGTRFHYTSFHSVLLGAVMASATQRPYLELMQEEVFVPSGMSATIPAPVGGDYKNHIATPYKSNGKPGAEHRVREWRRVDLSHRLPGGGFASTSSDLVKLGMRYLDDEYLSAKTRETFWTPQRLPDGSINPQNYALGWRIHEMEVPQAGTVRYANHGGVSRGGQSYLMLLPDYRMGVAVNINRKTDVFWDFGSVSLEIARAFIQNRTAGNCS